MNEAGLTLVGHIAEEFHAALYRLDDGAYVAGLAWMAVVEAQPWLDSPAWSLAVVAGWSVALANATPLPVLLLSQTHRDPTCVRARRYQRVRLPPQK